MSDYDTRRKKLKRCVDRIGVPLTDIVEGIQQRTEKRQSYTYINSVLNGRPGAKSQPVLDRVEKELEARGISREDEEV